MAFLKKRKGMTLLELLLVMIVVSLLVGTAGLYFSGFLTDMKVSKASANVQAICDAQKLYYSINNTTAADANLISEGYLNSGDFWNGTQLIDPWGNAFTKTISGSTVTLGLSAASQAKAGKNITGTYP